MSGIVGRVEFSGRKLREPEFSEAFNSISQYGGDGSHKLLSEHLAMGLHYLRVSRRAPPEQGPITIGVNTIVGDVLLDYRSDVSNHLGLSEKEAAVLTDSHLVLLSYERYGKDCLNFLYGDYAFAVYQSDKEKLLLVRDHIGSRPLFYTVRNGSACFASNVRGILAFSDIPNQIDEIRVAQFLSNPMHPGSGSLFSRVDRVPPGCYIEISPTECTMKRWWEPSIRSEIVLPSFKDYCDALRDVVEDAVAERLQTDGKIGSHVSGGIDSTTVSALASAQLSNESRALTAVYSWAPPISEQFPDLGPDDERRRILEAAEKHGYPCCFNETDGNLFRKFLSRSFELEGNTDVFDELWVASQAKSDGIRVLLSGWGGDEAFSNHGFGYIANLLKAGMWRRAVKLSADNNRRRVLRVSTIKKFFQYGLVPFLPRRLYDLASPFKKTYQTHSHMDKNLLRRVPRKYIRETENIRLIPDPKQYIWNGLTWGHLGARMETWSVWSSEMGFQYRYPLLDRKLLEFLLKIPSKALFADGLPRLLAKSTMSDVIPRDITKIDHADNSRRNRIIQDLWQRLATETQEGCFDDSSRWLEMPQLRRELSRAPKEIRVQDMVNLAEIINSVRMWHLEQRRREAGNDSDKRLP